MPTPTTPKLCRHRAQNQGYVTLNGRELYLGHWPISRAKKPPVHVQAAYDDLIAKWLANGRKLPDERPPRTVNEVLLAYIEWAEERYVPKGKFVARGVEDVEVPAGKYRGVRVEGEWDGGTRVTFWFAPEVGQVKRVVKHATGDGFTQELNSFTPRKK